MVILVHEATSLQLPKAQYNAYGETKTLLTSSLLGLPTGQTHYLQFLPISFLPSKCPSSTVQKSLARFLSTTLVVGGGTAGLAVAGRLSEDPDIFVGVIEAGAARLDDPSILAPAGFLALVGNKDYDWLMQTVPQVNPLTAKHIFPLQTLQKGLLIEGNSLAPMVLHMHFLVVRCSAAPAPSIT